jgi:hypothetical protein
MSFDVSATKGVRMKLAASNVSRVLLMFLVGGAIQGCGEGGGDGISSGTDSESARSGQGASLTETAVPADGLALTLFPTAAPPGSSIATMGGGFQGHCGVKLFLDALDTPVATAEVEDDGTFTTQFIIPEAAEDGAHTVTAQGLNLAGQVCDEPSSTTAEAPLTVAGRMPVITLETQEGRPGTTVEVHGRGFCGDAMCSAVTILLDGQVGADGVMVDADGMFTVDAFVPAISAAGPIAIVATQTNADGNELRAFGELVVTVKPNRSSTEVEVQ